ncbi:3'(2'),5'-bisphosphate nucleotidase CysQ [Mycobacterium shimoidei]|nr:3'(2'),5'-bisphosphate nucleotidase CysQ [Mycobacterium shimoidei]
MSDHELAALLATRAGELLLGVRHEFADATQSERKAAGDKRSHDFLMEALAQERPGDAVLSEEGVDNPARLRAERVWIVDPLDGTREFSELGRDDWAVHVALWQSGELVAGAVALPAQGVTLATPDVAAPQPFSGPVRIVVSRSRPPAIAMQVRDHLDGTLVTMGSAGAKVAAVVRGLADVYVHAGGQYEWDSAAPVAVARAAGLHTSRIDGSSLQYNRADPLLPDLLVCRAEYADAVLAVTGEQRDSAEWKNPRNADVGQGGVCGAGDGTARGGRQRRAGQDR